MTGKTGAPITSINDWNAINWQQVEIEVLRLQMRIAKAYREKKIWQSESSAMALNPFVIRQVTGGETNHKQ
jgi:hypothetical protein